MLVTTRDSRDGLSPHRLPASPELSVTAAAAAATSMTVLTSATADNTVHGMQCMQHVMTEATSINDNLELKVATARTDHFQHHH